MNYFLIFISLFLGLFINKNIIFSVITFIIFLVIFFIKDRKKICFILIPYALGIILYCISHIDISSNNFLGIVVEAKDNYIILRSGFAKYYISSFNNAYEVGDIILFKGKLKNVFFTNYESQFDFTNYLKESFVYKEIVVTSSKNIFSSIIRIKRLIKNNVSGYDEITKRVVSKLIFNYSLDKEYISILSDNQLFYLLSISSLHIHLFNDFFRKIFGNKFSDKKSDLIIIFINLFFFILSNFKISILRFLIYTFIKFLNNYIFKKKKDYLEIVSLTCIIILFIDIGYSGNISFIFGFIIQIFWLISNASISTYKVKYRKIVFLLLINILIIPILLLVNGTFSLSFIIFSQFLIVLIFPLFLLSIISLFIPLFKICNIFGNIIYRVVLLIDKLGLVINIGEINIIFILVYYLLFGLLIYFMENKQKKEKRIIFSLIVSFILINGIPINHYLINEVSFINVGQGTSTLICVNNTNVLVDTGGIYNNDLALNTLIPYFKKKKIRKLDYVFLTHNDYDHIGAFNSLINNFKVVDFNHNNNFEMININNLTFKNLNPSISNINNDDSLVLNFTIKNKSFLLMGDVSKEIEKKIIDKKIQIKCDYILIGHHGSYTSTSDDFIKYVCPKEAIISCGRNNIYNHPNDKVIEILNKNKVKIRRTDIEGTIVYKM